jgi:transposase
LPKDKRGPEQLPARFVELIGRLNRVEADARRDKLDARALQQQRRLHSAPTPQRERGG